MHLDRLRSGYVHLPRWLKTVASPLLAGLPFRLRYGAGYARHRMRIAAAAADPSSAKTWQLEALRGLVAIAAQKSDFYRDLFRTTYGGPIDAAAFSVADLQRLPVLTRTEVSRQAEHLLTVDRDQADLRQTSGSSGREPLRLYLDRDRSIAEMAFLHHIWSQIGYRLGDGRAVLRDHGGNVPTTVRKWRYDRALRELWLSPFHLSGEVMDDYLSLLVRYRVKWLYGVPSAITSLARHILRRGWEAPASLRGILPASEALFPQQREIIAQAFPGRPLLNFYGLSERCAIAGEVPGQPDTYAFEPLYGLSELVDVDGRPITEIGRRGSIVSTGFISRAMPLIRYATGDFGELVALPSTENGHRLLVTGIKSRWTQEYVFGRGGEPISVISLDRENQAGIVREYQYYQDTPGQVVMKVVPYPDVSGERLESVLIPLRVRTREVLDISLEIVDQIPIGRTGKRTFVDQRLEALLVKSLCD